MRENSIMTGKFTNRNIEGYLTVTREMLDFKKRTVERKNGAIIDLYLSQMLDAAMWQAHTLRLPERLRLAWLCLHKYRKYVSARTIGTLLFKSLLTNR